VLLSEGLTPYPLWVDSDAWSREGAGFIYYVVDNEYKLSEVTFAAILEDKLTLKLVKMALYF
jgi:hypothetical protein